MVTVLNMQARCLLISGTSVDARAYGGTLMNPYAGTRTFLGIEIINVANITVGVNSVPQTTARNLFDYMDIGVKCTKSNVKAINNVFVYISDITTPNPQTAT